MQAEQLTPFDALDFFLCMGLAVVVFPCSDFSYLPFSLGYAMTFSVLAACSHLNLVLRGLPPKSCIFFLRPLWQFSSLWERKFIEIGSSNSICCKHSLVKSILFTQFYYIGSLAVFLYSMFLTVRGYSHALGRIFLRQRKRSVGFLDQCHPL